MKEANELGNQMDEIEQGKSAHAFESVLKTRIKLFTYHDIRVSSNCKLSEQFCNSESIVNIKNDEKFSFLCCFGSKRESR